MILLRCLLQPPIGYGGIKKEVLVMKRNSVLAALLFCLVIFTITPVLSDNVPASTVSVPIYACTRIATLPYTINNPGYYYLAGNLSYFDGQGIIVNCDDVTIDLMGFCMSGTNQGPAGGWSAVLIQGRKNVEVRNGSMFGWRVGVEDSGRQGSGNRAIDVRMRNGCWGAYMGVNAMIMNCTATDMTVEPLSVGSGKIINCVP